MGAKYLTWARAVELKRAPHAPVYAQRLVLMFLADNANGAGMAWPSVLGMAEAAGVSPSTVRAVLGVLVGMGYIEPEGERSRGGPGNTTRWRLVATAAAQRPVLRAVHGPSR